MPKDICLATISLRNMAGGLERNIIRLANSLAREGHNVCLITFDQEDAEAFYPIDSAVTWAKIAKSPPHRPIGFRERAGLIGRIRATLKPMKRPVVVCFHHGILARFFLACLFLPVKIVSSERNSLTLYDHIQQRKWNLNFALLSFTHKITVQFPSYVGTYPWWVRHKIEVVPNIVYPADSVASLEQADEHGRYRLVSVGRLCAQKNYDKLISAFAAIKDDVPDWDLYVLGDGDWSERLRAQIVDLSLEDRVYLEPARADVFDFLRRCHLFCLPSQWEGFPNALAEALAHGLPAVGYAGCAGVRDLISDGENGRLAGGSGDIDSLASTLKDLMLDHETRLELGRNAVQSVAHYTAELNYAQWSKTLRLRDVR